MLSGPGEPDADRAAQRNVWVLAGAAALGGSAGPIVFAVAAIAGHDLLGPDKSLATLPIMGFVIGTACGTVPSALLARRFGRRVCFIVGMLIGASGALVEALALARESFWLLCAGSFLVGFAAAFVQQFRFAAADAASPALRPRAISIIMASGVASAVIGPQAVLVSGDLAPGAPFVGAFVAAAVLCLAAAMLLLLLDIPRPERRQTGRRGRPLAEIARRADFLIAVGCAAASYTLMSFVMTAAPLAMVMQHHGHEDAVLAIQWHVLAMYVPSFFTGWLITKLGAERIVAAGLLLLIGCAAVAMAGTSVGHFWIALVLLGVGWNFGFIGGTTLVTATYEPEEKEKVQGLNDFLIFGSVALASLSSGMTLAAGGWTLVNIVVLPVACACLAALFWRIRRRRLIA